MALIRGLTSWTDSRRLLSNGYSILNRLLPSGFLSLSVSETISMRHNLSINKYIRIFSQLNLKKLRHVDTKMMFWFINGLQSRTRQTIMATYPKPSVVSYSVIRHLHTTVCKNTGKDDLENDPFIQEILTDVRSDFGDENRETDNVTNSEFGGIEDVESSSPCFESSEKEIDRNASAKKKVFDFSNVTEKNRDAVEEFNDFYAEDNDYDTEEETEPKCTSYDFKRGKYGVFDIDELITILETENAQDICVIQLPANIQFGDEMIIVSAKSYRHICAIAEKIKWIYKRKKNRKDLSLRIEGMKTKDWFAIDMGNLILHIFLPETRERYDLESLWTLGPEFDESSKEEDDPYAFQMSEWPWLQTTDDITEDQFKSQKEDMTKYKNTDL